MLVDFCLFHPLICYIWLLNHLFPKNHAACAVCSPPYKIAWHLQRAVSLCLNLSTGLYWETCVNGPCFLFMTMREFSFSFAKTQNVFSSLKKLVFLLGKYEIFFIFEEHHFYFGKKLFFRLKLSSLCLKDFFF